MTPIIKTALHKTLNMKPERSPSVAFPHHRMVTVTHKLQASTVYKMDNTSAQQQGRQKRHDGGLWFLSEVLPHTVIK